MKEGDFMNIYEWKEHDIEMPEEIADSLIEQVKYLCSKGELEDTFDDESEQILYQDLYDALTYLKLVSDNQFNFDFFRTFYKVLSDITECNNRR